MKKADLKKQLREMVKPKPKQIGTKFFLHCYAGYFKLDIDSPGAARCCLLNQEQAMKHLKTFKKRTDIILYHVPGELLPKWCKGINASLAEIMPGMVTPLIKWLTYQHPTLYDDQTAQAYSAKLSPEEKQIMAAFSRIDRFIHHEP